MIAFPAWRPADIISWLGLGSVAISFAFQEIFKYFLGEILLLLHEPFQAGDRMIVEGFEGTVEKILRRSTQIISDRGERVIVPKAIVFTNSVRVLTTIPHRRTNLRLILAYETGLPEQLKPWLKLFPKSKAFCPKQLQKVDTSGINQGFLHLIVPYWKLREQAQVRRTKTVGWRLK
ncbi:mechanosensitive ion channel domain-containing protein [Microcoleus sp. MON2_D5]|uniref:mechanosensitive ion channel domain-containing protein n=1 Tax=Microcoleus sp. MON2_D5 TaxID=2818833 RepID=UPI002FD57683